MSNTQTINLLWKTAGADLLTLCHFRCKSTFALFGVVFRLKKWQILDYFADFASLVGLASHIQDLFAILHIHFDNLYIFLRRLAPDDSILICAQLTDGIEEEISASRLAGEHRLDTLGLATLFPWESEYLEQILAKSPRAVQSKQGMLPILVVWYMAPLWDGTFSSWCDCSPSLILVTPCHTNDDLSIFLRYGLDPNQTFGYTTAWDR